MKYLHRHGAALALLVCLIIIVFRKFFFQGLVPIPYNMLVGWYFPYQLGDWTGYLPGIPFKGGLFAADVFRQMIPWKQLALELLSSGQIPLWNPYNFSGEPLLANIQVSLWYPLTLIHLLFQNFDIAWSVFVIMSPIVAYVGMYFLLRSFGYSTLGSIIGGLSFAFSGHMLTWLEWGVVTHSSIWIPWLLLGSRLWIKSHQKKGLGIFGIAIFSTITAGYPQEGAFSLALAVSYLAFLIMTKKPFSSRKDFIITSILPILITILAVGCLAIPQLVPTFQLYQNSALKGETSEKLFLRTGLDIRHMVNMLAPDYFGNRIFENYWADRFTEVDYSEANLFIGTLPILGLIAGVLKRRKTVEEGFFILLTLLGLLVALKTPLHPLIAYLRIPMISTGDGAGSLIISLSCISILVGAGISSWQKELQLKHITIPTILYLLLAFSLLAVPADVQKIAIKGTVPYLAVAMISVLVLGVYWVIKHKLKSLSVYFSWIMLVLLLGQFLEITWYAHRILSFSPVTYSYPEHRLVTEVKSRQEYYRSAGLWENDISANFHTAWRLYGTEGYNPLHSKSYQEFVAATHYSGYPAEILRSDAIMADDNLDARNRFFALTSTKYIVSQVTDPQQTWETEPLKYSPDHYELVWQLGRFKLYEFSPILERVHLYAKIEVNPDSKKRLDTLFNKEFNIFTTAITEKPLAETLNPEASGSARIKNYTANSVSIETQVTNGPMLLVLNDTYYPSWKARVNNQDTEIYRVNHTFRGVLVPSGLSEVLFTISWP